MLLLKASQEKLFTFSSLVVSYLIKNAQLMFRLESSMLSADAHKIIQIHCRYWKPSEQVNQVLKISSTMQDRFLSWEQYELLFNLNFASSDP